MMHGLSHSCVVLRTLFVLALHAVLLVPATLHAKEAELPYPAGRSSHRIEGLQVELDVPKDLTAKKPASLVVILHGAGGTATGMASVLRLLPEENYVVCAPKSVGKVWQASDLEKVKAITKHLLDVLPIEKQRFHVVGYSNGSFNLHPLAFHETLMPASATWVAGGHVGGPPPKWTAKRLAALCLVGANDANLRVARETVKKLQGKVRTVEIRTEKGKGHEWPDGLMAYYRWWVGVAEGRIDPATDMNFNWTNDVDQALKKLAGQKKGGALVWIWKRADKPTELDTSLQRTLFQDPDVRFFGEQLVPIRLEVEADADAVARVSALAKLKKPVWPVLVVLNTKGVAKKVLSKKITQRKLVGALRKVAPIKKRDE